MAKRKIYGKSPWGAYFMDALSASWGGARLDRGRSYANTGKVVDLDADGPKVSAKVQGNYKPWYRVKLSFPAFLPEERKAILEAIRADPALLAAVYAGEVPMELVDRLRERETDLLPRNWNELQRSCDCPDDGDPCKHMAAVYYCLARELDQDPFAVFRLRGLDLKAEFPRDAAPGAQRPLRFAARAPDDDAAARAAAPDPDTSLRDSCASYAVALLRPNPAFHDGDFKTLLAEFHHHSARRYEALLTVGAPGGKAPAVPPRSLSETSFGFAPEAAWEPPAPPVWPLLRAAHPAGPAWECRLIDAAPAFLACGEGAGTPEYRFLFHLYRLFFSIVRAGAFVPAASPSPGRLQVIWKPLSTLSGVAERIEDLGRICPPLIGLPGGAGTADGRSSAEYLLAALCTQYVKASGFRAPAGDPVEAAFFAGAAMDTAKPAYRSVPGAVAAWLAVLDQRESRWRYRFSLKTALEAGDGDQAHYLLKVETAPAGPEGAEPDRKAWKTLYRFGKDENGAEALSFALMLGSYLPELATLRHGPTVRLGEDRLLFFLREAGPLLRRLGAEVTIPKELSRELKPRLAVRAAAKGAGSLERSLGLEELCAFDWTVAVGGASFGVAEFQALVKEGRGLVRLKDGFLSLDAGELGRLLAGAERKPGAADAMAAYLEGAEGFSPEARVAWDARFRDRKAELPAGLNAQLRPYQLRGYRWAWNNLASGFGCLLADDMGLGKTVQAISLMLKLKEEGRLEKGCLAVAPASLLANWSRELRRFAPGLAAHAYYGPRRRLEEGADVELTTYETVLRDAEKLAGRGFSLLVLDEAQNLKNAAAKRAQAVRRLDCAARIALSGTPVENRLEDLRAILDLVLPGYLGDAAGFRSAWRIPIELNRDEERAAALKRATAPFVLRRLKTDPDIAPDLPAKTVSDEYARLEPAQAALYESVLAELMARAGDLDDPLKRGALALKLLSALKQVCNHPRAYDGQSPCEASASGKAKLLLDLLSSALEGGEKILVFSQYVGTLEILEELIRKELGEACLVLHGGLSPARRAEAVDRFQNDSSRRIFLISLKAGGVGLNLTAATRVVHYDLWFNPAVENQASDRAFRIGQTKRVFVHRLICEGTFEERIDALIKTKAALAELSVAQGESWLADLGAEELKALFKRG